MLLIDLNLDVRASLERRQLLPRRMLQAQTHDIRRKHLAGGDTQWLELG